MGHNTIARLIGRAYHKVMDQEEDSGFSRGDIKIRSTAEAGADKGTSVGQDVASIVHDFNNILGVILGRLEAVARSVAPGGANRPHSDINLAIDAARNAIGLAERILEAAGQRAGQPVPIRIPRVLAEIEPALRNIVGSAISWRVTAEAGLWPAMCDPNGLENAIVNLVINARDAMPDGGHLSIDMTNVTASPADNTTTIPPGRYVMVAMTDSGSGMTPDVLAHMFDRYFTTKRAMGGTGLGMSAVRAFVDQANGHIRVVSTPGQGTAIALFLPRYDGQSQ